ncbi:MAG: YigZ family protein [Bacteroidales bacterium]|nr:YigZ family protein [Bacteroidales bacterium]
MDSFLTISNKYTAVFKDKKSSFHAVLYPINKDSEIKEILKKIKKEYHDANHHCYAYRYLNVNQTLIEYYSDDGEPANSAGIPILHELQKKMLVNVLAVVVRYFGGIKLGVPGLIYAYRQATRLAIQQADILSKQVMKPLKIECKYQHFDTVMSLIKKFDAEIESKNIDEMCVINVFCPKAEFNTFVHELRKQKVTVYA